MNVSQEFQKQMKHGRNHLMQDCTSVSSRSREHRTVGVINRRAHAFICPTNLEPFWIIMISACTAQRWHFHKQEPSYVWSLKGALTTRLIKGAIQDRRGFLHKLNSLWITGPSYINGLGHPQTMGFRAEPHWARKVFVFVLRWLLIPKHGEIENSGHKTYVCLFFQHDQCCDSKIRDRFTTMPSKFNFKIHNKQRNLYTFVLFLNVLDCLQMIDNLRTVP